MSKSLGNSMVVADVAKRHRPIVLRYYLASPHYRSMIEYSEEALEEAATAFARIEQFVARAVELAGQIEPAHAVPEEFAEAMDDDLGVPQAMAVLHNTVRAGNVALAAGDKETAAARLAETRAMLGVLGLDPLTEPWVVESSEGAAQELRETVGKLVAVALDQRQAARERRDFASADAIRAQLGAAGIQIEDTPSGPRWSVS
jgi:cysteinyl-tRNA synthetase